MTYDEAIKYFGTQTKLGAALGITQATVSAWHRVVPPRYQYQLEVITQGRLLADEPLRKPTSGNHDQHCTPVSPQ